MTNIRARAAAAAPTAVYIYCLVERARAPTLDRALPGLPGSSSPQAVAIDGSLWAIASNVPLARYGSASLANHLHDINWVADIGVRHEAVVERLASMRGATVLPMKLFTMFSTVERAQEDLRGRRRDIADILERVRGCQEWGIRVSRQSAAPRRQKSTPAPRSGAAFLAAKKRARDAAREQISKSSEVAESTFEALSRLSRDAVRREPPQGALAPPLVDAAFLVATADRARFRAAVQRSAAACRRLGAALVVTGPWPPYNFVGGSEPEGRA